MPIYKVMTRHHFYMHGFDLFRLLLAFFIGLILVDPTNQIFHLKEICFIILIIVTLIGRQYSIRKEVLGPSLLLVILAIISLLDGFLFFNADMAKGIPYIKTLLFLLVFIPLSRLSVDELQKLLYFMGFGLALWVFFLGIGFLLDLPYIRMLVDTAYEADYTIMIAKRDLLGMDMIMFFYKTMPFCFFSLIYALRRNLIIPSVVIFFSIFIGGSRTPILVSLAILAYILTTNGKRYLRYMLALLLIISFVYLIMTLLSIENQNDGDTLKFSTAYELLSGSSFWGHGVGIPYYTSERGLTASSEVTYFEMLYHYGWLKFPFVVLIFFYPVFKLLKFDNDRSYKDYGVAYLLYLVNAGTNPLLLNSTGIFVFACTLTISSQIKKRVESRQNIQYTI